LAFRWEFFKKKILTSLWLLFSFIKETLNLMSATPFKPSLFTLLVASSAICSSSLFADTVGGQIISSNWTNYGNYTFINNTDSGVNGAFLDNYGTLNFQGNFQPGTYNWAVVKQWSGSLNVSDYLAIARYSGSGYLEVDGGALNAWNRPIIVGESGNGSMGVYGGYVYAPNGFRIAMNSGSVGTLNLNSTVYTGEIHGWNGTSYLSMDGGYLQATGNNGDFLSGISTATLYNNSAIDNAGYYIGISQSLGGTGGLSINGSGTTLLYGNNSYSGRTYVNNGQLTISGGSSSSAYTIASGARLSVYGTTQLNNPNFTFSSGGGGSIYAYANNFIMGGDSTYTTTGGSRNLIIDAGGSGINLNGNKVTFDVARGTDSTADLVVSTTLSHSGSSLTKTGNGILELASVNTYGGGTTISAGTLKLGHATNTLLDTGAVTVSGGILDIGANSDTVGALTISSGSITGTSGTLTGSSYSATNASGTTTISAKLGGSAALTKTGNGALTLSGANTYTGDTTVSAGTLNINGSIAGSIEVNAGATLGGSGTIGGNAVIYGTHSVGNSPGLQSFSSNLAYKNASTTLLEFSQNSTTGRGTYFDAVNVGGNLAIESGAVLNLIFNGAGSAVLWSDALWKSNQTWLLYQVNGTTTGSFSLTKSNWLDSSGNTFNSFLNSSSFSITQNGQNVMLAYSVPEPSTYGLVGLGALALAIAARRRRKA
jgi:autotransporter-associated beta strand protein